MIKFYCGVNDEKWNRHPTRPGEYACIAPIYGRSEKTRRENRVSIPVDAAVLQDCGAFSDGPGSRLCFRAALDRQLEHGEKWGYSPQITHRASYDLLIDEKWVNGQRRKRRWSEDEAWAAVDETVAAAEFAAKHYRERAVLSAQGVTPGQYLDCARRVIPAMRPGDILGLGGWCISGMFPTHMRPVFNQTMLQVIPFAAERGVEQVHIWGVSDVTFLGPLLWLCDRHGLRLSTDSSAPQARPTRGVWGFRGWYKEAPKYSSAAVEVRGIHRILLVKLFRCRLATLRGSEFYHHPSLPDGFGQLNLFG